MKADELLGIVQDKGSPASDAQISQFERERGADLPSDYREFLAKCNGGYIGGKLWHLGPFSFETRIGVGVRHIYGLRDEARFTLGRNPMNVLQGTPHIPREFLAIMDDPFGNQVCIGLHGRGRGEIHWWDCETGTMDLIASSFTEFLAGLRHC